MKKKITTINETACAKFGISRDEYALIQYIQYRSADPRSKASGWCCDTKEDIADFVRITRVGVYKMVSKLVSAGLIERSSKGFLRAGELWFDTENDVAFFNKKGEQSSLQSVNKVYTQRKQSSPKSVNKVNTECKQSLQQSVNKVNTHYKVEEDISKNKDEVGKTTPTSSEKNQLKEGSYFPLEEEKKAPPVPGAPPAFAPARFTAFNQIEELEALETDQLALEHVAMSLKVPQSKYQEYLSAFRSQLSGTGEVKHSRKDLRQHFFNFASKRWQAERDGPKSSIPGAGFFSNAKSPEKPKAFYE